MKINVSLLFVLLLLLAKSVVYSQSRKVNPNGFNIFYYPNGFKLSEGYLRDGKPDGYWITYYINGKKKSEGNRKNFLLDSVWIFYAENGDTLEKIYYLNDKKNGYDIKYYTRFDSVKTNTIKSKELYVDDKKQGYSFYYYPDGTLHYKINYKDNYKQGKAFEYDRNGKLTAIEEYRLNRLISRQAVNRYDENNRKTGLWIELYDDGNIKKEINFEKGLPNGVLKEFSPSGTLLNMERYHEGKLITKTQNDSLEAKKLRVVREVYPDGKLKAIKTYRDTLPYGLQIYYSHEGKIEKAEIYDALGLKEAEGLVDTNNHKQGQWTYFFENGIIEAIGTFKDDKKNGLWRYFYPDGKLFETGDYTDGIPDGKWVWYYSNGNVMRVENYNYGDLEGKAYELSINGDTLVRGQYSSNQKTGHWYYAIGDEFSEGKYIYGRKTGLWKTYYFPEMKKKCLTEYYDGQRQGKHKCYYKNGNLKEVGKYYADVKTGLWFYYQPDGTLDYKAQYLGGVLIKINDHKISE